MGDKIKTQSDVDSMTLDEIWEGYMRMWKWIAGVKRVGISESVRRLKANWLENHGYGGVEIENDCFFCHWVWGRQKQRPVKYYEELDELWCDEVYPLCPARKVDRFFTCNHMDYSYSKNPQGFYAKLQKLDAIRRGR